MRYFIIIIIKSSTQQQPKYPCAYNFTLVKQKRNLKLSKWKKKMYLSAMKEHINHANPVRMKEILTGFA